MIDGFLGLSRTARRTFLLLLDAGAVMVSVWAGFAIRFGEGWPLMLQEAMLLFPLALGVSLPIFWAVGFYRSILRYAGRDLFYVLLKGTSLSLLLVMAAWLLLRGASVPRSAWLVQGLVLLALIGGSRLLLRDFLLRRFAANVTRKPVIIYGAGVAGVQLAIALKHDPEFIPVAFVDDSPELQHSLIVGLKVYKPTQLSRLVQREQIDAVLLALPSISRQQRRLILDRLTPLPVRLLVMPSLTELASGTKRIDELRDVDVEDILGRDPIKPQAGLLTACIRDKTVLVTGAGGSIGAELCRQIIQAGPRRLVLLEWSEYALYRIERELSERVVHPGRVVELVPVLASVTDRPILHRILREQSVQTVYHAAAFKHVPIVETNPIEGVRNNVFGTLYTAEAAIAAKVETFVFVSTDKAVRPCNVMGASKRFAELVLQGLSGESARPRFCMVRFGNVLASSGSVVPLFREQIRHGGPVTVTHPEVTRYFMTIPEAAQLVIQAGSMAAGGEVFVLDMGEPVRIEILARRMIELSGFQVRDEQNPGGDIEIRFTGLREGEKLHEELLLSPEHQSTSHPMIRQAREASLSMPQVRHYLDLIKRALESFDETTLRALLHEAVDEGIHQSHTVKVADRSLRIRQVLPAG
ncbi:MAG: nucleoside-diphosphate sugar epimerase/dehydratase [Candidatus Competibacterales bacterium]|nr:nucleoside-diphosphate sugar epimerase/dehydratase [Candidatus Competibacterales bacterium]